MAKRPSSSKKPRACTRCGEEKALREYPGSCAEVCTACLNAPEPVKPPPVETDELPRAEFNYSSPTSQELAARILARRRLLPFIQRFKRNYKAGWVHKDMCRRLERFKDQIAAGESPRLLLMMPPRTGKSEAASRHFAPWLLGHYPDWEIIAASNAQSLATSFSRYIRDVMRSPSYQVLFSDTVLDPTSQSVENWNTTQRGGYLAAGVGTAIVGRGANCFVAGTRVRTPSGYTMIEHIQPGDAVLGYDHASRGTVSTVVRAVQSSERSDLVKVSTRLGRRFVSTGDHPVFVVGEGFREAARLTPGAVVRTAGAGSPAVVSVDHISSIVALSESPATVYDIQVAHTNNFFAEEILVHNCLIIDDPVRDADAADSLVQRDSVWEWYVSTAYTRLAPGGGVLGVLTWWGDDDWAGRVQQAMQAGGDQFEVVKYPAINDQGDEYILVDDSIIQLPPGEAPPEGATLTRPMNTALHPERYTLEMLQAIKANYYALGQQRWWSALYQQNPTPEEGAFFTKGMFRHYGSLPHKLERHVYQAWDFAITEKQHSDYTVGTTLMQDAEDALYVADVTRFKSDDGVAIVETVLDYWVGHGSCAVIGVEDGQIWRSIEGLFKRRCQQRGIYPSYEVVKPYTDKFVRAQPLRGRMQAHTLFFDETASWYEELRNEFLRFGSGGKHDDIVDSLSWAVRLAVGKNPPAARKDPRQRSWRDKLAATFRGRGSSHMAA